MSAQSPTTGIKKRLSARWLLRIIGILMWGVTVVWLIAQPGFEPLAGFLGGLAAVITSFFVDDRPLTQPRPITDDDLRRNRGRLLDNVHRSWIEGVLNRSLYGAELVKLGIMTRPEAVDMVLKQPGTKAETLPPNTAIIDVFDKVGQELLILGEPGAGKTTTLLELARELINRARLNPEEPIPVVFNLSSSLWNGLNPL